MLFKVLIHKIIVHGGVDRFISYLIMKSYLIALFSNDFIIIW